MVGVKATSTLLPSTLTAAVETTCSCSKVSLGKREEEEVEECHKIP
jgi:hypothetical protein